MPGLQVCVTMPVFSALFKREATATVKDAWVFGNMSSSLSCGDCYHDLCSSTDLFCDTKGDKKGEGEGKSEVMDRWLDMFVGKAGGASLNPHMYQEPQEDPWKFTCQPAYLKQQSLANPCMCTHMHLCTYTCMYNRHPTK